MNAKQITTVTFFRYKGFQEQFWALSQMGLAIGDLLAVKGLTYFKLMGSGAGEGFSLRPDFSVYCFLGIWENEAASSAFFEKAKPYLAFAKHSCEQWTIFGYATRARGLWSGQQPFELYPELAQPGIKMALTRASIHWQKLPDFWRHVPATSRAIAAADGVLFSKGVGELPLVQQATISIWESEEAMRQFAYKDSGHREIVKKTVQRKWYKEELFASFYPYKTMGKWEGGDPIKDYLT